MWGLCCNNLDSADLLIPLINATHINATRIDVAVDIETDVDPFEFVAKREGRRFRASGQLLSDSGATAYIGGRTSERMARVYRYAPPHPRSHLLRVESEYKRDAAKMLAGLVGNHFLMEVAAKAHEVFGWQHPVWTALPQTIGYTPYRHLNKENAKTLQWLYGTVISSLVRLDKNKAIDLEDWLKTLQNARK